MENWKQITNYPNYFVSDLGNVKSCIFLTTKNKIKTTFLSQAIDFYGYNVVCLYKNKKRKTFKVHQLVAEAFLNHVTNGHKLVVNHKDFNRKNNNVDNLEIVTQRENGNKKHIKSTSKYVGVHWHKRDRVFSARIFINNKSKHLGNFLNEIDAHNAYQKELQKINNNTLGD